MLLLEQKQRELLNQMCALRELIEEQKEDRQLLNDLRQLLKDVKGKLPDKEGK